MKILICLEGLMGDRSPHFQVLSDELRSKYEGCEIREVRSNGEEAFQSIWDAHDAGVDFDIVFLGVMIPKLNGWEVCKFMRDRAEHNATTIVIVTAIGTKLNNNASPLYGADVCVDVPFDAQQVVEQVAEAVENRKVQ